MESGVWQVEKDFSLPPSTFYLLLSNRLGGPFNDLFDTPPFLFAEGPGLDQEDLVADVTLVFFIMRLHLRPLPDILFIDGMKDQTIDHDDGRLIHFFARNHTR